MLQVKHLNKTYGRRQVIQNLNFCVESGKIYGLLGANGAGKTTTINIICNLINADSGSIKINQQLLSQETKKLIGVVTQDNLLYKYLTCAENLDFYAQIYGLNRRKRTQRVRQTLAAVNLLERANCNVENLSGGMQRKLNIAVALVHQPKLLILDEPTSSLDLESRYEIWDLILTLSQQGITILLTTHFLDEAQRLCQRIGILKEGKMIAEGSLSQLQQLIPAQEIVTINTPAREQAIALGKAAGFIPRYYGGTLAFWLPEPLELGEIIPYFPGLTIDAITKQAVQLEHIYLELTQ